MAIFGHDDSLEDRTDDRLHEEKGRWEERWDNFRESLSRRFDEADRPQGEAGPAEPSEYDEATDEHLWP